MRAGGAAGHGAPAVRTGGGLRRGLAVAGLVVVLDQLSKWWVLGVVMQPPRIITVAPFFNLVLGWNRGISFGLFDSDSPLNVWLLPVVAVAIIIALLLWLRRARGLMVATAIGMVIGGAAGNVIDRLRFGAVADFLDFHVAGHHWPAFNLADAAITVGAALLILDSLFARPERHNKKARIEADDGR